MGRFYRAFLSLGSLVAGQDNWAPILEFDGAHMKHEPYNGVCVLLVGKDGDWSNILVAVTFVHKETADNFECFFANCVVTGIKLHDRAVFSDRGKQREAQIRLHIRGIIVHLKFCSLYIFLVSVITLDLPMQILNTSETCLPVARINNANGV
ncbi:unnamed protein product [Phytophthora fragariaefolia]|uniref:Unnamed protein product n=1 Tax=Phytophthora fragariaefolia TaxID=1490495 RepID=A0A9W7DA22_9STRA|nr:unnamed protein product [Phytophthora fragariaefolia]